MESVTYLFNNMEARSRVLFCGKHFTLTELEQLYKQRSRRSPSKTTLTGQGGLEYVSFAASTLRRIGKLNDQDLSKQLAAALGGALPWVRNRSGTEGFAAGTTDEMLFPGLRDGFRTECPLRCPEELSCQR